MPFYVFLENAYLLLTWAGARAIIIELTAKRIDLESSFSKDKGFRTFEI